MSVEILELDETARRLKLKRLQIILPVIVAAASIAAWEFLVRFYEVPHYFIPAPTKIWEALVSNWRDLGQALLVTMKFTFYALFFAVLSGVLLATVFALSRVIEFSLFPYVVTLQVTPIVAIAPLIMIYAPTTTAAVIICAWLVAFFPILSSTVIGLRSTDHNLQDLFTLYGANRWQRLRYLLAPSALPYFMSGLKIAGGLSLIGAVVAEFVAGAAGAGTGLATRILEASFRSEIPRMFAALVLNSLCGVVIFLFFSWLSKRVLGHWHESEIRREV